MRWALASTLARTTLRSIRGANLYVGEVAVSYPGGSAPADWTVLRKYVRV